MADQESNRHERRTEVGVIHGRFQVLHYDHVKYLLAGKGRCRHLIVGITNPDPSLTKKEDTDTARSDPQANPLTYFERHTMVRNVLLAEKIPQSEFSIVPFPINVPELIGAYVPLEATFYLTILDDWGRRKREIFHELGLQIEILWEKPLTDKGLCGTDIRRMMVDGGPWENDVPPATAALMKRWNIPARLRGIAAGPAG